MSLGQTSEQQLVDELVRGRELLFFDKSYTTLLHEIRKLVQSITPNLYILDWISEQTEDLYAVLVDTQIVVQVEIPRMGKGGGKLLYEGKVADYIHQNQI